MNSHLVAATKSWHACFRFLKFIRQFGDCGLKGGGYAMCDRGERKRNAALQSVLAFRVMTILKTAYDSCR